MHTIIKIEIVLSSVQFAVVADWLSLEWWPVQANRSIVDSLDFDRILFAAPNGLGFIFEQLFGLRIEKR